MEGKRVAVKVTQDKGEWLAEQEMRELDFSACMLRTYGSVICE